MFQVKLLKTSLAHMQDDINVLSGQLSNQSDYDITILGLQVFQIDDKFKPYGVLVIVDVSPR